MRLWHESLIPYLPRQQLLGLHREVCALRGLGWGKPHATVNYVFQHSPALLIEYHIRVMDEMKKRGYAPDEKWYNVCYRGKEVPETDGPMYSRFLLKTILDIRNDGGFVYPEHNAAYLRECLDNLARKGIKIEMEE